MAGDPASDGDAADPARDGDAADPVGDAPSTPGGPVDLDPAVEVRVVTATARVDDLDGFLADLERVGGEYGCTLQAFDARAVAGPAHLRRAVALADRAIDRGENVARDRAVEVLVYAAGRRQIDDALALGVGEGEGPVAVVVAADPDAPHPDPAGAADAVADLPALSPGEVAFGAPDRLRDFFGITDRELAATDAGLADLVLERVALLDVEK